MLALLQRVTESRVSIDERVVGHIGGDLARPHPFMAAPTILKHEFGHVNFACAVKNAVAAGEYDILFFLSP